MKITKERLKKLISEEIGNMTKEGDLDEGAFDWFSKQSDPGWAAKQVADIEADAQTPKVTGPGRLEQGLDKLLADFRNGLLGLLQPQVAEATELETSE
tara:strand:- start:75 stop:368 length:294 start_codon:yes stop_codon:yes gene_type:complete